MHNDGTDEGNNDDKDQTQSWELLRRLSTRCPFELGASCRILRTRPALFVVSRIFFSNLHTFLFNLPDFSNFFVEYGHF